MITFDRIHKVTAKTGMSRSWIYEMVQQGKFPRPIRITSKAVGWVSSEVDAWIDDRIQQSRPPATNED